MITVMKTMIQHCTSTMLVPKNIIVVCGEADPVYQYVLRPKILTLTAQSTVCLNSR